MNVSKLIFGLIFILLIQGCASPSYDYIPEKIQTSKPPIGTVNIAYVGDALLTQGVYLEHDAILLDKKIKVGLIGNYTFFPGYYTKTGGNQRVGFYQPSELGDGGRVKKGAITDPFQIIEAQYRPQKICGVSVFNAKICTKASFEVTSQQSTGKNSFQQTLLYSGKVGDKINFGYREFSGNVARPAFNNDVEYDLSTSSIIGYKGARIEVLEATNEFIRYKVFSNFNTEK